jgi:cobalt/nickel transport system permease protein
MKALPSTEVEETSWSFFFLGNSMHLPDGFLSHGMNGATFVISAGACAYAVRRVNLKFGEREVPLMGVTAAFIFAAQMINFPIAGGTSGHFLGAVFSSVLLGPWAGLIIITLVLAVQCLGFADGGLTALGANVFNMGVVGALGGYGIFTLIYHLCRKSYRGFFIALAVSAWFSVVMAATATAFELAMSGTSPLVVVLPTMVGVHAIIAIGEAVITTTSVSLILKTRPDLVGCYVPPVL